MHGFSSDVRYALRTVRHGGISTLVAVLSLAVGVGANAAIFSVGYAMLRPMPSARANGELNAPHLPREFQRI